MRTGNSAAHGAGAKPLHHLRERGTNMLYWLLPDPFNPAVNFGDVIACLAMCAGIMVLFVNVPRNGR